ncbi:MAG: 6,7-dimethyl-8-ribityllumazine synthase [Chloroflexota bacterium]
MTLIKKFAWNGASVALAAVLAVALLVGSPASIASAAVVVAPNPTAADGTTTASIVATHWKTGSAAIVAGDTVTASTTAGTFANGSNTQTIVATGASVTFLLKHTAGATATVTLSGTDASAGFDVIETTAGNGTMTVVFYGAPSKSHATTDFNVNGVASNLEDNATSVAVVSGQAINATIADAGGRLVAGAPYTMEITGDGVFSASGQKTVAGVTTAGGATNATNLTLSGTAAASGTITLTVNAATGQLVFVGKFHRLGTLAGSIIAPVAGFPAVNPTVIDRAAGAQVFAVRVRDTANNFINGPTVTAAVATATFGAIGGVTDTGANGIYNVTYTPVATQSGEQTITFSIAANTTTGQTAQSFAVTFVQSGVAATVTVTGPDEILAGGNGVFTATVRDAAGFPVVNGAPTVTFAVTGAAGGNLVVPSTAVATTNGVATATFVSGGVTGPFTVTAVPSAGTASFKQLTVVTALTPAPGAGEGAGGFTGSIAPSGVSLVVYGGGTVAQLAADAAAAGVKTISVTVDGAFKVYVVGAPAFVNAGFPATLAANTPVIVVK